MDTPESSPVKSNPVIQVEPDTTVIDERSADQSHDVIILGSLGEDESVKNEVKKQFSATKLRQNKSKSSDKAMVKRNLSKPETHVSPTRSPSPAKKTPKKPCAKETQRSLRFGSKRSEEVVDTVDLTDSEEQTRKSLVRKTRTKMELKSTNKRSLLPTDDSDPEQIVGVSPRRRLRTNSLTKHSNKTKESPERSRISSTRRHTLGSQDNLQGAGSSKKSHLRSSSHHNLSPRSVNNSRSYSMKKEGESDVMTRSKTGWLLLC